MLSIGALSSSRICAMCARYCESLWVSDVGRHGYENEVLKLRGSCMEEKTNALLMELALVDGSLKA
jgi:hypothetical protein